MDEHVNEVRIRGRVSGVPRHRQLPSGDELVSIRVVVPRVAQARPSGGTRSRAPVDTIECVAWTCRPQAVMSTLTCDDQVLVTGALRRRFWRAGGGVASTFEVEVAKLERVPSPTVELPVTGLPVTGRRRRQASGA
jgi:single-strand DNA-binding protein